MTVEEAIQLALLKAVEAYYEGATPKLPIAWPNRTFTPPADGSSYLEVRILPNRNTRLFLGSNEESMRMGILQVNLISQFDKGPGAGIQIAGQIVAAFPQDRVLRESGVKVQLTKTPDVGPAVANPNGTNWIVPVSIYYEAFA
jgi:hypothetical protein